MRRFKTYGYITMSQALSFVSDLKFGHYMKIPPRTMFMAQVVATTFSCFIQVAVLNFALNNIEGVCDLTQPQRFTCPGGRVFFSGMLLTLTAITMSTLMTNIFHPSLRNMGSHRTFPRLFPWGNLLRTPNILRRRCYRTYCDLVRREEMAPFACQTPDGTTYFRRSGLHPACYAVELSVLGPRRLLIPIRSEKTLFQMVEPPELPYFCRSRFGPRPGNANHLRHFYFERD